MALPCYFFFSFVMQNYPLCGDVNREYPSQNPQRANIETNPPGSICTGAFSVVTQLGALYSNNGKLDSLVFL